MKSKLEDGNLFLEIAEKEGVGMAVLDAWGRFTDVNKALCRILRSSRQELLGRAFADFLPARRLDPPGSKDPLWLTVRLDARKDEKGVPGFACVVLDISEQRKAQEALHRKNMMYSALFEFSNDAVFLMNLDGERIMVNHKAADLLGYSVEELNGKSFREIIAPSEFEDARRRMKDLLAGKPIPPYERLLRRKDGAEFPLEITPVLIRTPEGDPLFIQSVVRDISEKKRAEETLRESLREKEVMLREIHHRVKNNMQIISSLLRLQSRLVKDRRTVEMFKESQNRIRSMALIHEKLYQTEDFSRINFAQYIRSLTVHLFHTYRVNPNVVKMISEVEDVYLDINKAIPCGLILNELVSNALKHAFPGKKKGEIYVKLSLAEDEAILLVVADDGVGLPLEVDFKEPETLGLQLVKDLVDQLEGTVRLDRDGGTAFTVTFRAA